MSNRTQILTQEHKPTGGKSLTPFQCFHHYHLDHLGLSDHGSLPDAIGDDVGDVVLDGDDH